MKLEEKKKTINSLLDSDLELVLDALQTHCLKLPWTTTKLFSIAATVNNSLTKGKHKDGLALQKATINMNKARAVRMGRYLDRKNLAECQFLQSGNRRKYTLIQNLGNDTFLVECKDLQDHHLSTMQYVKGEPESCKFID